MAQLPNDCAHGRVALRFAEALAKRDFDQAFSMLATHNPRVKSKEDLAAQYSEMIAYASADADNCETMIVDDDWPSRLPGDLAWVYVSMSGPGFSEAVVAIVVDEEHRTAIRVDDWGRP